MCACIGLYKVLSLYLGGLAKINLRRVLLLVTFCLSRAPARHPLALNRQGLALLPTHTTSEVEIITGCRVSGGLNHSKSLCSCVHLEGQEIT
jgi:hypothetical protein